MTIFKSEVRETVKQKFRNILRKIAEKRLVLKENRSRIIVALWFISVLYNLAIVVEMAFDRRYNPAWVFQGFNLYFIVSYYARVLRR